MLSEAKHLGSLLHPFPVNEILRLWAQYYDMVEVS